MSESLLILLREGFEAALIVAIVFAYLRRIGRLDLAGPVWAGVAVAAGIAAVLGVVLHVTIGDLEGQARLRTFAAISILAAGVLTWMVFWMRRQGRAIKGELEHRIDDAIHSSHVRRGVMAVAFLAVLREGIETALFLIAAATDDGGRDIVVGGLVGLAAACGLGYVVYRGGRSIPVRAFFQVTGMVIVVFAAGLVAKSVLFLQASGDLATWNNAVYDLTGHDWLTQSTQTGRFLAGLFGWDPRPSIEQCLAWLLFFLPVTAAFLRPHRIAPGAPSPVRRDTAAHAASVPATPATPA
jgi:high-affinity iron transporter